MIYDLNMGQDCNEHGPGPYLAMCVSMIFLYEFGGGRLALHNQIGASTPNRIYGNFGWLVMHCWISRVQGS